MGRPLRRVWGSLATSLLLTAAAPLLGCAQIAVLNVRALRAYGNEDADPVVIVDRLDDVEAALGQIDKLLRGTPYTPGDAWVKELALDDARADRLRTEIRTTRPYAGDDFEVPIVKLYRRHLDEVLRRAEAARSSAPAFPSILDGMAQLSPSAAPLKAQWALFDKAQAAQIQASQKVQRVTAELVKKRVPIAPEARDPASLAAAKRALAAATQATKEERRKLLGHLATLAIVGRGSIYRGNLRTIAEEALAAISTAERVDLEVLALLPIVANQAKRLMQIGDRDLFRSPENATNAALSLLPLRAEALRAEADAELAVMEESSQALSGITGIPLDKTAGYTLRESVVDQVVGVNLDSIHGHLKLDGEALFFNQIGVTSEKPSKADSTTDFTGRSRRLEYQVDPIVMVGGKVIVAFDFLHRKNAASLNAGFSTNRIWSTNGTIDNGGSLADLLNVHGFASDLLNLSTGLLGIQTRLKAAEFTAGQVREIGVSPLTGADTGLLRTAPLKLQYRQIDIGYDVGFLMQEIADRYWIEELLVGFRYMGYRLPRILYELSNTTPAAETSHFAFQRESPAQNISSEYFMGGIQARFGQGDFRRFSFFGDLGVYAGSGPMSYYFLRNADAKDTLDNRLSGKSPVVVVDGTAGLGLRVRLTPKLARFRVLAEAQYHTEVIYQTIISELLETTNSKGETVITANKKIDFGGTDVFHGPRLQIVGVF